MWIAAPWGSFSGCVCSPRHGRKSCNETWAGSGSVALVLEIIVVFQIRPRLHRRLHGGDRPSVEAEPTEETPLHGGFSLGFEPGPGLET